MGDQGQTASLTAKVSSFLDSYGSPKESRSRISFENMTVIGSGSSMDVAPTILSAAQSLGSLFDPQTFRRTLVQRTLLHSFNGQINPGEMVLVIGKPGSGCTTFLKSLCGLREEFHDTTGSLKYGGYNVAGEVEKSLRRTFCAEEDEHLPTLSVEETIRFAVNTSRPASKSTTSNKEVTAAVADLLGLGHVLNTRVGNAAIRGVSGGERRRVSLAEALATDADVLCLDNPTNGLDSSTALEFVKMMREYTTQSRCAAVMSVYQGSDAMMSLFDKVLVISQGRQVFYGRSEEAVPYFERLGHRRRHRTTVADFLTSMTADRVDVSVTPETTSMPPRTAIQLEQAFKSSRHYEAAVMELKLDQEEASISSLSRPPFQLPIWKQVMLCSRRQFLVLATNYHNWLIEAVCLIAQSLALGTLFFDQPRETRAFFSLASSLFFCALVPALQAMAEFGNTFAGRALVIRQRRLRFYRPLSYSLGLFLTDLLWKVVAISYNIPQYFLTGFQYDAGKFFTWFLVVYVEHMAMSMLMRAIAVSSRSMTRAVLPVGIVFTGAVLYAGFYIPPPNAQVWLGWVRYLDPIAYAWESLMINEFADQTYLCSSSDLAPSGPNFADMSHQVCAVAGSIAGRDTVPGSTYIEANYGLGVGNLWRNVGINLAIMVFFTVWTGIGMELHKPPAGKAATVHFRTLSSPSSSKAVTGFDTSDADIEKGVTDQSLSNVRGGLGPSENRDSFIESHEGRTLCWRNLSLDIDVRGESKRLLQDLNGFVRPKQLTALMGMSGAGKTTLLNSLAGRLESGKLQGDIYLDGKPLPASFRRIMGYVQQQDIHLPTQTVREALQTTAELRQPESTPKEEKHAYVERVILMLELEELAEALIGVPGAGLTLEQRKRVSIGVELAARPEVLFLDEPTSGLDGLSALNIVRLLRRLVDSGQTVLCTIHQPADEVIETFDHLILLIRGGRLAYDGPLGPSCSTAIQYFQEQCRLVCAANQNPAEFFLDVVGAGSRSNNTTDWADRWLNSVQKANREKELDVMLSESQERGSLVAASSHKKFATSIWTQISIIMRRTWVFNWRDPDYLTAKLLMNLGNGLFNGLTYLNAPNTAAGAYNRALSAFVAVLVGPPLGLQAQARFMPLINIFLLRDRDAMSYHWLAAVIPAIVVEIPNALLTSLVYWLVWYFPVGYFTEASRAGYSLLLYELFAVFEHSLAQLIASAMPNLEAAFLANGFFFMFINTLAGTLSPESVTPSGWKWYYQLNPLYYYGEGAGTIVLEGLEIECSPSETYSFTPPLGSSCVEYAGEWLRTASGYLLDPNSATECQYCRYKDGQSYYAQYGWQFSNRWRDVGIFIGFIAFNYVAVLGLLYSTKVHKWRAS